MTPEEIIRKEFGSSSNLLTPYVIEIGALPFGAYELSWGKGFFQETIYGVSVVRLLDNGTTERVIEYSAVFFSRQKVIDYIESLKEAK